MSPEFHQPEIRMQHTQWVVDKLENVDDICISLGSIEDSDKGRIPSIYR